MKISNLRTSYIDFFKSVPRSHKEISPARLIPTDDPTTLFTSSGMQQLVPYLTGKTHPQGKRLVDSQQCLRLEDMDEVGDIMHTTFFEMLGNWSLGDYFKDEQLNWFWEFLTKNLSLSKDKLWVSVFAGHEDVKKDEESYRIWRKIGVSKDKIVYYGIDHNWWSRSGPPDTMPEGEIGGPDSEVFYDFGVDLNLHEKSAFKNKQCHPNCGCGRFIEIGNSVFIEYEKKDGILRQLPQKNVDFGGGLERMMIAVNNTPDIFKIGVFEKVIGGLENETSLTYGENKKKDKSMRIIADHLRASIMLISQGLEPSNKMQGYVLRKLIRRSIFHLHLLGVGISGGVLVHIAEGFLGDYPEIKKNWKVINSVVSKEGVRFGDTLERGLRKLRRTFNKGVAIDGKFAFDLYQTDGFPLDLTLEILMQNNLKLTSAHRREFEKEFKKHREISRKSSSGIFKGGLADKSIETTKLHTTTHLLHSALRRILGEHIKQKGSNITSQRLRFDFSHEEKLTSSELKEVQDLINQQISQDLPVVMETKTFKQAVSEGATALFINKYEEKVDVYTIGKGDKWFSKEVCGGPHVHATGKIGHVRIKKQEKIGTDLIRIYAELG